MTDLTDIAPAPLHLERLTIHLARRTLVTLDTTIAPGEILTVMGPSGSGKSTLLAAIAGFLPAAFRLSGHVRLGETPLDALPAERRRVGLLFQDPLLFPHLSVGGNLAFGMAPGGRRRERRARVAEALARAGLAGYADRDPATLSGGQKARVALLRVLLSEPRAMLLDEPFSSLDVALRDELRRRVVAEIARRGLPALLVTHDPADAEAAGGRIVTLGEA
ncbi:ATP-binding cassette domain-containing protein [Modicisalibacter tunisiensis]|uniref:ATP-binding cassette domain-containing protein n=1 Tax=Modicisalibacter tunisiensis TaxID=390637 RepID=A0ABS7X2S9_9GAMM|nr:ATP-binding cassette domain-containing protein [Modicisalibacter tunisiensis]MBZ9569207.1 ATP-binding cassette domain-containing protein [Modicisalibacter tunisiensis]